MFSKLLTATAVALSASTLVAAQTSSTCDPTKTSCRPVDPAFGNTPVTVDFTKGPNDVFEVPSWTTVTYDPALGAVFAVSKDTDAPSINTKKYLFYGKVDVVARASLGVGVVTSVVLQSDDLDEIDWEWLGGDGVEVQTNYFSKGDTTTYDRGGKSPVSNPQAEFHTYTIEWTPAVINWIIDGTVVRTLTYNDAKGGTTFPQTPMQLKLGTWVAGKPGAPQGTVDWAGGYPDYSAAPFYGYYKSVSITDYTGSAGDKIVNAGTYTYADGSGSSGSIQVHLSDGSSSGGSSSSSAPGSTSKATTTAAPSTSSTASSSSTLSTSTTAANSTTVAPTQSSSGITAGVITTSSSSSKPTTSSPTTVAPGNAAGKLAIGFGNAAVVGAAMFVGALAL